jgi:hypothetical protein
MSIGLTNFGRMEVKFWVKNKLGFDLNLRFSLESCKSDFSENIML